MFLNLIIYIKQSTNCLAKSEQEECIFSKTMMNCEKWSCYTTTTAKNCMKLKKLHYLENEQAM